MTDLRVGGGPGRHPIGGRLDGRRCAHRRRAAGRAGRIVRPSRGMRPTPAPGRRVRSDLAPRHHGPKIPLATGASGRSQCAIPRSAGHGHLPQKPYARRVRNRATDPTPNRRSSLPTRLCRARRAARRGRYRLFDPAPALHQRRSACHQLDHDPTWRLHDRPPRDTRSRPPAARTPRRNLCAPPGLGDPP